MTVENRGNLITRRAFADTGRMALLRQIVNKAMSTAYQMTEEVGEYGSGTPSPLHMLCELIREAEEADRKEGAQISTAQELAEYALLFLRQLRGERPADSDTVGRLNFLMKNASDANFKLKGRNLKELTPGELQEFAQRMLSAATLANELWQMAEDARRAAEDSYPGAPVERERLTASR